MTVPAELEAAKAAIAAACHRLAAAGLVIGSAGNISQRIGDVILVTATGAHFTSVTPEQVTVVDLAGRVVEGGLAPTSELELHLGIYGDTTAASVVHTHAPMATAVGLVVDELPCVHYQMLLLGGAVKVAPYATFGSSQLAGNVRDALVGKQAALMANHGAVTLGSSLEQALDHAELLEWSCALYARAAAIGKPRFLDDAAQLSVIEAAISRRYGTLQTLESPTEATV